ncbi:MAG TPA: hypothetical protein PKI03_18005 [Pseudomonadota bacterium]|nr:hypothetical protein [Pseudomonadota bacterium]
MTGLADIDDLLARWDRESAATSFTTRGQPPGELRFAIALPADPLQAKQAIQVQESSTRDSHALLSELEASLPSRIAARRIGRAFGVASSDAPFADLGEALESGGGDDDSALGQVQTLIARVQDFVTHFARIETATGSVTFASSRVGWTGDVTTIWASGITDEKRELHLRAVRANLQSRLALVRLVSLIVAGAGALAVQWALPGGTLRALPMAWRLARELIAEAKRFSRPASPTPENPNERGNDHA